MGDIDRRTFMRGAGAATAAALASPLIAPSAAAANETISGTDLTGFTTVLGDGVFTGPGQAPPDATDLATNHYGTHSELVANVNQRGVMAHNIAYKRFTDLGSMATTQFAESEFRIPELPTTSNWNYNAQTLEAGLFVWDGPDTRLDYGLAMQWVLNPWVPEFGQVRIWNQTENGPVWTQVGYLEPDTEWHTVGFRYRASTGLSHLILDGSQIDIDESLTVKQDTWGNTIDGRFQLEIVSVWPGSNPSVPAHRAEFRNWSWTMT